MSKTRVLTGITTTGTPHLGNYVGAIRPAIAASRGENVESYYFMADYHALIKCDDPARIARSRLEIAATWLACGLDPDKVYFYRQSDIPEIPELTWLLTCVTAKGLMNRAHAYKAAVDANSAAGEDADAGITMGLYSYPILMAADILIFNAHRVPVGRDQIQHIEMARDIAARFNHLFGAGRDYFVLPEVVIEESVATLPGLDGRKMSKSYDNTVPLFEGGAKKLKETIARIVTDSRLPGEAKDPDSSALMPIYRAFADEAESADFRAALAGGLGWGEAKQRLFERLERDIAPMRARYEELIAQPARIEEILQAGAARARQLSVPFLAQLREAVGLRRFQAGSAGKSARTAAVAARLPQFKQYRENDGRFYFKLLDAEGRLLLQSEGLDSPKQAGQCIAALKAAGALAAATVGYSLGEGVAAGDVDTALAELAAAAE
ncbi:tryptophan--tRNA ligase [Tahibacter harae]|uniref:Tryptophan--tRNA ligase n=1 Tax=Tahibacter harae TaxID=2963937 RepID=A0ABT1QXJ6_9GAMM|nr:tryptophan--tRNA ligase [Tahibacter harae]MCQ4167007.1 tryptophan--tRNA ligase [Tahibacter harae]